MALMLRGDGEIGRGALLAAMGDDTSGEKLNDDSNAATAADPGSRNDVSAGSCAGPCFSSMNSGTLSLLLLDCCAALLLPLRSSASFCKCFPGVLLGVAAEILDVSSAPDTGDSAQKSVRS